MDRATESDALGRILKETYPSGYYTFNSYDNDYGYLKEVKDANEKLLWKAVSENARGQLTKVQRGDITTTYGFDSKGLPTSIQAPGILKLRYSFDNNGNLAYRQDSLGSQYIQKEVFQYDELNRLTNWNVYQNEAIQKSDSMVYNPTTGTITSKSDLDNLTMLYGDNGKPHALTGIDGVPSVFPTDSLSVSYTDFKKIKTITEGNKQYVLTYGIDDQRRKSEYKINGVTQSTRYYLGDYEEVTDNVGNTKKIHYLSGGAILINTNGVETLYYGYNDYRDSQIALDNDIGTVVERYAYDPWGKRRNPADWTEDDSRTSWTLNRGYTMHEHLDAFNIINMNGRVYDPLTAMFFSSDPFVQAPDNWLNYNRYGYAFGNPFKYTDPDGEFIMPIIVGAMVGGFFGGMQADRAGGSYLGGFLKGAIISGLSVIAGAGVGQMIAGALTPATTLSGAIGNGVLTGASSGFAGGFVGGAGNAWINGADFSKVLKTGLISGGFAALTGGTIGGILGGKQFLSEEALFRIVEREMGIEPGSPIRPNDTNLNRFTDYWFRYHNQKPFENVTVWTHENLSEEAIVRFGNNPDATGLTIGEKANGVYTGRSRVYFSAKAFSSSRQLFLSIGHELVHVQQFSYLGSINATYTRGLEFAMEIGAYGWQQKVGDNPLFQLSNSEQRIYSSFINSSKSEFVYQLQNGCSVGLPNFIPDFGPRFYNPTSLRKLAFLFR